MNYEEMSDFEINKAVADIFLPCDYLFDEDSKRVELANYQDVMIGDMHDQILMPYQVFNPCKNPSYAWPIIEMIWERLMQVDAYYQAHTKWEAYCIEHEVGKLRAAMICFLKMKHAENGKH